MKLARSNSQHAFTLPEVMIAASLLVMVLAGIVSAHIFGMRMFMITKAKLGTNDGARKAISKMTSEIRSGKWVELGSGSSAAFTAVADGTLQQGNAIQIYSTTSTNPYVRYFMDTNTHELKRKSSQDGILRMVAENISNNIVFSSETFSGTILTNNENNRVIGLTLKFYQIQYPIVKIGPGEYYDYYQFRVRTTRRTLE